MGNGMTAMVVGGGAGVWRDSDVGMVAVLGWQLCWLGWPWLNVDDLLLTGSDGRGLVEIDTSITWKSSNLTRVHFYCNVTVPKGPSQFEASLETPELRDYCRGKAKVHGVYTNPNILGHPSHFDCLLTLQNRVKVGDTEDKEKLFRFVNLSVYRVHDLMDRRCGCNQ
ncbi:hypothetical protein CRG98_039852 [Punica granatum]|uniref:Uncharacterized protein n=1 Tax=Punica granatum TaxID=22663 RepID=A0A2I0I753_PUNGR|nr:hypothetical protein CRG98_039852 [Punica granatum]